eukprot:TRINITY_DN3317_c0_g3_i3.p1 TRINITY_DN3317_c0_g3~~TRINITY_DN3317_c0_g3_i3.p1  ORF type:complete len:614 (+),score=57.38 TRINITY_DN3317_c0_g3_i3:347-2188(+)
MADFTTHWNKLRKLEGKIRRISTKANRKGMKEKLREGKKVRSGKRFNRSRPCHRRPRCTPYAMATRVRENRKEKRSLRNFIVVQETPYCVSIKRASSQQERGQRMKLRQLFRAALQAILQDDTVEAVSLVRSADKKLQMFRTRRGRSLLHLAARYDSCAHLTSLLLRRKADPNARDSLGAAPLHIAARYGRVTQLDTLIAGGADPNCADNNGWTPLMVSCRHGHADFAQHLLRCGSSVLHRNKGGRTALHVALVSGKVDIARKVARVYLEQAAEPKKTESGDSTQGASTPGSRAHISKHLGTDKRLWAALVRTTVPLETPNMCSGPGNASLHKSAHGTRPSALQLAILKHEDGVLEALAPSTVEQCPRAVPSLLETAVRTENASAVRVLLAAGADPNVALTARRWTCLHVAAKQGKTALVSELLQLPGIDPEARTSAGQTALHLAVKQGHTETALALLASGSVDVNATDRHGWTALRVATVEGHAELRTALEACGATAGAPVYYCGRQRFASAAEAQSERERRRLEREAKGRDENGLPKLPDSLRGRGSSRGRTQVSTNSTGGGRGRSRGRFRGGSSSSRGRTQVSINSTGGGRGRSRGHGGPPTAPREVDAL